MDGWDTTTEQDEQTAERDALPSGDPVAWAVLTEGTLLAGLSWPGWGNSGWDASFGESMNKWGIDDTADEGKQ